MKLHRELMDASRRAGMADVASEVLHNVGNVLNSLNVSIAVLRKSAVGSLIPKLAVANRELSNHQDSIGDYLENHERGKHFPAALDYITGTLETDRQTNLAETDRLIKNIDHVRTVIQQQLSLSRDQGVIETFCLLDLIEHSVQINQEKIDRAGATVTLRCQRTLNLMTDRHKLQQILINLISNAVSAVQELVVNSGRIEINVHVEDKNEEVAISVIDNGVGIAVENLSRIFSQGFTTKSDGHGYGLHSCAMTAQVLGGQLSGTSSGIGRGACFQLVIPIRQLELCKI